MTFPQVTGFPSDPAQALTTITTEWDRFVDWTNSSDNLAKEYTNSSTGRLSSFSITQLSLDSVATSAPTKTDVGTGLAKPTDLAAASFQFSGSAATAPTVPTYDTISLPTGLDDGSSLTAPVLTYVTAIAPGPLNVTAPGNGSNVGTVTLSGAAPVPLLTVPANTFAFTETPYSSTVLTSVKDKILDILLNGAGIPANVEQALFDRARAREDVTAAKALQEVTEEWASRGFSLPSGVLLARQDEVRQKNQDAANQVSREILIQQYTAQIENMKFAVQSGVQFEGTLIEAHMRVMQRAFESSRTAVEMGVAVFNAEAALHNLKLEAHGLDIEGDKLEIEKERLILEGFRARVEAYAQQVAAKKTEFEAYQAELGAMAGKAELYQAHLKAASLKNDLKFQPKKFQIDMNAEKLQRFLGDVNLMTAAIQREVARVEGEASLYDAKIRAYGAHVEGENSRVAADVSQFEAALSYRKTQLDAAVQKAQLAIDQVQKSAATQLEALKTATQSATQLAASAMSALHLAASSSFSGSDSRSNSYSLSDSRSQAVPS
jgi:hypothetical protein